MIVITGTQRCGTSAIATCLAESGYDLGSTLHDDVGSLEHEETCAFYRDYLGDPTFPFDDFKLPSIYSFNFAEMGYEVVKFSYLLMNPVFVHIWFKFRKNDSFLVMERPKHLVIRSKMRHPERFNHDSYLLKQTALQLRMNYAQSREVLSGYTSRIRPLRFPQCLHSMGLVNLRLEQLDPNVQIDSEVWKRIIDLDKVHIGDV